MFQKTPIRLSSSFSTIWNPTRTRLDTSKFIFLNSGHPIMHFCLHHFRMYSRVTSCIWAHIQTVTEPDNVFTRAFSLLHGSSRGVRYTTFSQENARASSATAWATRLFSPTKNLLNIMWSYYSNCWFTKNVGLKHISIFYPPAIKETATLKRESNKRLHYSVPYLQKYSDIWPWAKMKTQHKLPLHCQYCLPLHMYFGHSISTSISFHKKLGLRLAHSV